MSGLPPTLRMRQSECAFVANYLRVLVEWDARAAVRIQQRGTVVGIWGAPPTQCLTFIAVPLSSAGEDPITDRTVSAGRLRDCLGDVSTTARGFGGRSINVPEAVVGSLELMRLPPREHWEPIKTGTAQDVVPGIDAAIGEFRQRVPQAPLDPTSGQRVADEIWSRPGWGTIPIRALHTAKSLGFLANSQAPVQAQTQTGWTRFITASGQVFSSAEVGTLSLRLTTLN